jgi:hypothetical protein
MLYELVTCAAACCCAEKAGTVDRRSIAMLAAELFTWSSTSAKIGVLTWLRELLVDYPHFQASLYADEYRQRL